MSLHVLHISKAGGTAIGEALTPVASTFSIHLHDHRTTLRDISEEDDVLFFVREPISRYVSAFNTRIRRGRPRNDAKLRPGEERAFALFPTPNALAEALVSSDADTVREAREAMSAIVHVNTHVTHWLETIEYVRSRRSSIVLLGLQRFLDRDFAYLKRRLGLPESLELPSDAIGTHRTPEGFPRALSAVATAAIADWYREDVAFYRAYQALRAQWFDLEIDER